MNWPIGDGDEFQGVYDRASRAVHLFVRGDRRKKVKANIISIDEIDEMKEAIGERFFEKLLEDIEVLDSLVSPPDLERIEVRPHPSCFHTELSLCCTEWRPDAALLRVRDD